MKQILQNLKTGNTELSEAPVPACVSGQLLIQSQRSLISSGTERMLVEFGKVNILQKARSQPEKVKQVLDKVLTDGLVTTLDSVSKRLSEPLPLGYCNAGEVIEIGESVSGFQVGDRVISNGSHAEVVSVPVNLCAKIPDCVSDEDASFTVLSSIALQGIRLAKPEMGENFVVIGTGLIGLISVQLLKSSGCNVMALDVNDARLKIAKGYGSEIFNVSKADPIHSAYSWSKGKGVDGVLITASAKSNKIVHQSAQMSRKHGRIILVGVVGLELQRSDFYEKELTFQVSCSYGPGRYDKLYEKKGIDYPLGYVRWTENRNFETILDALATQQLKVNPLISHRFPLAQATDAYEAIFSDNNALGVILEYQETVKIQNTISINVQSTLRPSACVAAMIGSGNFAKMTMAPALAKTSARLKYVTAQTNSVPAVHIAHKYGFENVSTDLNEVFSDEEVNTIFISTNHNSHASLIVKSLSAGKHVFAEKPLALNIDELKEVYQVSNRHPNQHILVGFNRRFSPHIQNIKEALKGRSSPLAMTYNVNAGIIPMDVWVHDPNIGGGRIIGEGCHFLDVLLYLTESRISNVSSVVSKEKSDAKFDTSSIILQFEDGSIGTINYYSNGHKSYPKEVLEIYSEGRILKLDNFLKVRRYGFKKNSKFKTFRMDKGHNAEFVAFVDRVEKGGAPLIPLNESINVTLASFAAVMSANEGRMINLDQEYKDFYE